MSAPRIPQTPVKPGAASEDLPVPVTPEHRSTLITTFSQLTRYINREPDMQQRHSLILAVNRYALALAEEYSLVLPDTTSSGRKGIKRGGKEDEDEDEAVDGGSDDEDEEEEGASKEDGDKEDDEEGDEDDDNDEDGDGEMQDVVFPGEGKQGGAEARSRLEKLTLAMTAETDAQHLSAARDVFLEKLEKMKVKVATNNSQKTVGFTAGEAVEIANFFFAEMMGPKALGRLGGLIRLYSLKDEDGMDHGVAARAHALSKMDENPAPIRAFYHAFSSAQSTHIHSSSGLAHMAQIGSSLRLLERYNRLRDLAAAKDTDLIGFLRGRGYSTRRGVNWQSCIVKYLADSLEIPNSTLQNRCQAAQGVAALKDQFGNGIIPVLPIGTMNRLNRWGNQRMAKVYPLLKKYVPSIEPICKLLNEYIYDPMQAGAKLQIQQLKTGTAKPLMDRVVEAVKAGRDDGGETGSEGAGDEGETGDEGEG